MNELKKYIREEELLKRIPIFILGVFIISMNYNLFVQPNSFVLGGSNGISIILNYAFGFNPVIALAVLNVIFLVISLVFLGKKETRRAIAGSILYPLIISITLPLCNLIMPYINFNNYLITVVICGLLNGLGTGLIYRVGFNTGGGDILTKVVTKYFQIAEGKSMLLCNGIILGFGTLVFGFNKILYSIIIIIIVSTLTNKILIGVSDSKMFFIYSKKYKEIEKFIMSELNTGVTLFNTEGGYKKEKREMLMVVVPTRDYYRVKDKVLKIDDNAFFVVSDCYEVTGGSKRKNLPFI